jgi:hypothetical protein
MMQTNLNGGRSFLRSLRNVQFPTCGRMVACRAFVIGMALAAGPAAANGQIAVSGELKQWHKVTLTLDGPLARETDNAPNPFTDYRMTVTFRHESGSPEYMVPGYFAADGDAANSSADALVGNVNSDNSKYCLATSGSLYPVCLPDGGTAKIDLSDAPGTFTVQWFNPRHGGPRTSIAGHLSSRSRSDAQKSLVAGYVVGTAGGRDYLRGGAG